MSNLFIYLGRETGEQLGSSDREMMLSFDWDNLDQQELVIGLS
jgi:hypothetical protein